MVRHILQIFLIGVELTLDKAVSKSAMYQIPEVCIYSFLLLLNGVKRKTV